MPRKRTIAKETQRFPIDDGAVVVIEFDPTKRPKMVYLDGVVIIGEHQCGPIDSPFIERQIVARRASVEPIRNFEVSEDDPAYVAFKARLATSECTATGQQPAPPDFSPPVITNADLGKEFADKIRGETGIDIGIMPDPAALVAAAK